MRSGNPLAPLALVALLAAPAFAQETVVPTRLSEAMGAAETAEPVVVTLRARLAADAAPLASGIGWSVFERRGDAVGERVAEGTSGELRARLAPGDYAAHVSVGGASTVLPFTIPPDEAFERTFDLDFGAVRLHARAEGLDGGAIDFAIHDREGRRSAIRAGIEPGTPVVLPAGTYRAVIRYGRHNAVTGADIRVHAGEVTEATLAVKGAPVKLALVRNAASDAAVATVTWRLFDSGGKPLLQTDEPTPSLVLAPGNYTAEVLHGDWTTVHRFAVESNEAVEVRVPLEG